MLCLYRLSCSKTEGRRTGHLPIYLDVLEDEKSATSFDCSYSLTLKCFPPAHILNAWYSIELVVIFWKDLEIRRWGLAGRSQSLGVSPWVDILSFLLPKTLSVSWSSRKCIALLHHTVLLTLIPCPSTWSRMNMDWALWNHEPKHTVPFLFSVRCFGHRGEH